MKLIAMAVLVALTACSDSGPDAHDEAKCPPLYSYCEAACVSSDAHGLKPEQVCMTEYGISSVTQYGDALGSCVQPADGQLVFSECLDTPYVDGHCYPATPDVQDVLGHSHSVVPNITPEDIAAGAAGASKTYQLLLGHEHTVTFTPADFVLLRSGQRMSELSTMTLGHQHMVSVGCL